LHTLVLEVWTTHEIPRGWRRAEIIPLPKVANATKCDELRGIALTSHVAKVASAILARRVARAPLGTWQTGFRPKRGTNHAIATVQQLLGAHIAHARPLYGIFIDCTKAFDSVSRPLLLAALEQLGAGPNTLAILAAMYAADEISVRGAPPDAEFFASAAGVKQGDNASPCLFVAVLDIILRLAALDAYVVPRKGGGQLDATVIGYADDLVLFHSDPAILQANFRRVADTLAAFGLQVNVKKTEAFGLDLPTPIRRSAEAMLNKRTRREDPRTAHAYGMAGSWDRPDVTLNA
jgi:hypothetical protein